MIISVRRVKCRRLCFQACEGRGLTIYDDKVRIFYKDEFSYNKRVIVYYKHESCLGVDAREKLYATKR